MAIDFNKGGVKGNVIISPKGRMLYPALLVPTLAKGETDPKKAEYKVMLLLPKAADLTLLAKAVNDVIAEKSGGYKGKIKRPFEKTEDNPRFAEYADEFPTIVKLKTAEFKRNGNRNPAPKVIFSNRTPCTDETEIYGGRWAAASVNAGWWEHPTGGKGVTFYLHHVMLLDHADSIGYGPVSVDSTWDAVEVNEGESAEALFG